MAKIIDFKTRKTLANLPTIRTRRVARAFKLHKEDELRNTVVIIAGDRVEAQDTLFRTKMYQLLKKAV